MRYFTDGRRLFEVVSERSVENYGRRGGLLSSVVLRDVVSEESAVFGELDLLAYEPVERLAA